MRDSDAELSFEDFVRARSSSLLRTALLLVGQHRAEAEDLLQFALERAYRHWPRIRSGEPERYVRRILANASADRWRKIARRAEQLWPTVLDDTATPDHTGEIVDRDYLLRALAELPPGQRAVLVLRYFDDLSEGETAAMLGFAQLVGTAGQPLGPRYRMPPNYLMGRGVGRDLLLDLNTDETQFELWDPTTRRVLGHFDNVVGQGPDQVVWSRGCQSCPLEITNVSTGKTVTTSIPGGAPAKIDAALSDDGALLAVQLPGQDLTVINTRTGSETRIGGTALVAADFEYFDWQNAGHRLIITAGPNGTAGPDQIAYWQPGDTKLHVETIRNVHELPAVETGAY